MKLKRNAQGLSTIGEALEACLDGWLEYRPNRVYGLLSHIRSKR